MHEQLLALVGKFVVVGVQNMRRDFVFGGKLRYQNQRFSLRVVGQGIACLAFDAHDVDDLIRHDNGSVVLWLVFAQENTDESAAA